MAVVGALLTAAPGVAGLVTALVTLRPPAGSWVTAAVKTS
jgi:hypothetical protein